MNPSTVTHVDGNATNTSPNDFNPHDQPHFPPELGYPHSSYPQRPPSGGVAAAGVEQRRLAAQVPVTATGRTSRKRKSPPKNINGLSEDGTGFDPSADFSQTGAVSSTEEASPGVAHTPRAVNQGKRAEQNRKAQRAFRERREIHVKELEARSQLLDAALGSADEANRRWEECRALVDQLRVENAGLRAEINGLRAALGNAAVAAAQFQQQVQQQPASSVANNGTSTETGASSVSAGNEARAGKPEGSADSATNT